MLREQVSICREKSTVSIERLYCRDNYAANKKQTYYLSELCNRQREVEYE